MIEVSEDKTQYEKLRILLDKRLSHPRETFFVKMFDLLKRSENLHSERKFAEFLKDTEEKNSLINDIDVEILLIKSEILKENIKNGRCL
jgi:hypothetical protein